MLRVFMCYEQCKKYQQMICDIIVDEIKELEIAPDNNANNFSSWELIKYLRGMENDDSEAKQKEDFCFNNIYAQIIKEIKKGDRILEIGSGNGVLSAVLSEEPQNNVLGVDVNEASIYISKKLRDKMQRNNLDFLCCDLSTLSGVKNKFDIIICIDIIGNFLEYKTAQELGEYVEFLHSFLSEKGNMIIFDYKKVIEILEKKYSIHNLYYLDSDKTLFSCVLKN